MKTPTDQLKVGMWFINKMGGVKRAKIVLEAAALALKTLEESK